MINYDLASEGGMKVFGDGGEDSAGVVQFKSAATVIPALTVGKTVNGSSTIGVLKILGTSGASCAIVEFGGGFISCTSIDIVTAANSDYVLPVSLNGVVRYIPLVNGTAIKGGAAFS
jgi:hypothetical protein